MSQLFECFLRIFLAYGTELKDCHVGQLTHPQALSMLIDGTIHLYGGSSRHLYGGSSSTARSVGRCKVGMDEAEPLKVGAKLSRSRVVGGNGEDVRVRLVQVS
jgi:hypothetical protein